MTLPYYAALVAGLWDWGPGRCSEDTPRILPGACPREWAGYVGHDWDDVDRLLLDQETLGGE